MKKILVATMMAATAMGAMAQATLVKEVSNAMKDKSPDYQAIIQQIQPALTNPETATDVEAWLLAAKANVSLYDNLYKLQAIGQDVDKPLMGKVLMDGIECYITALPLDSVPDAKGKIKAKNSKEILKQIKDNYNQLNNVGADLYNAHDFNGAYRAWDMVLTIPDNPVLGKNGPVAFPDSTKSDIAFNKGIASWQADSLQRALNSFKQAISLGYDKKQVYDYAISIAAQLQDNAEITALATQAYPIYGDEDPKFLQLMINDKIENKQYEEARSMLDEAIAASPENPQLYFVLGILEETLDNKDAALKAFEKSIELDPDYAQGQYSVGRTICNLAYVIDDEAGQGSQEEYMQVRTNKVNPMFKEAAVHLEKAYQLDPDNMHDALRYLRNVYYNLGDEENLKRVENL